MKNIYPEYPCFVQDFISSYDCQRMGFEQFGIYNWMLMQSWVFSEKPCHLPNDPNKIAWLLRTNDNQLIIKHISEYKKWHVTEDGKYIYNPKLLSIYEKLRNKSNTLSDNRLGKGKNQIKTKH